jgi:hypothetical protein
MVGDRGRRKWGVWRKDRMIMRRGKGVMSKEEEEEEGRRVVPRVIDEVMANTDKRKVHLASYRVAHSLRRSHTTTHDHTLVNNKSVFLHLGGET